MSTLFPPFLQVQLEAGTHPVTVGFSTVWLSLTTEVPRVLTQTAVYCRIDEMPLHGSFIPCNLYSILHDYLFANKLILKSILLFNCISYTAKFFFSSTRLIACRSISWIPFVYLLEHPSSPASGMLPTGLQYNGYFINTLFISSTHHCLSLLIAFNTLFLSRLLCFLLLWM